jgi:hypothetical protein
MTVTVEPETDDAAVFASLSSVDHDHPHTSWNSETRLQLLTWEIARYEPALAAQLVESGKRKLMRA